MEQSKLIEQLNARIKLLEQDIELFKQEEKFCAHRERMKMLIELVIENIAAQWAQLGDIRQVSVDGVVDYVLRDISNTHNMALQNAAIQLGILPDEMVKPDAE